jgi:hypothetical protein
MSLRRELFVQITPELVLGVICYLPLKVQTFSAAGSEAAAFLAAPIIASLASTP